ncbi:MAG: hypothetical protein AB8G95_12920 [Anaerolineae bacterium]
MISAPHSTRHTRQGNTKLEEEFTAAFAHVLAKNTRCHAIFNEWEIPGDPNWDKKSAYKTKLAQIVDEHQIELVIDLHGMTNRHNLGIAIGTMNGRACPGYEPLLAQALAQANFNEITLDQLDTLHQPRWDRFVFDHPRFTGGIKSHTVTRFAVEQLDVAAVQIELTSAGRMVYRGPHSGWPFHYFGEKEGIQATMQALENFVASV